MAEEIHFTADAIETNPITLFDVRRQSPTDHLLVLRRPNDEHRNTDAYLSPGLHNISDAWVRYLRSKSHELVDEFGKGKNQRKLMDKSVPERKAIIEWCHTVRYYARTFILGVHDDEVARRKRKFLAQQSERYFKDDQQELLDGDELANSQETQESEASCSTLRTSGSRTSLSTAYESVFDCNGKSSDEDEDDDDDEDEDEDVEYQAYHGPSMPSGELEDSAEASQHVQKEMSPAKPISMAERRLASAWDHWGRPYLWDHPNKCSWLLIKSQMTSSTTKALAARLTSPLIQVTTPDSVVYDLIERQAILPMRFYLYAEERERAQAGMALAVKRWRGKNETYTEYVRRLDAEEWWAEMQAKTANEMFRGGREMEKNPGGVDEYCEPWY
jgi:hypothetical protein